MIEAEHLTPAENEHKKTFLEKGEPVTCIDSIFVNDRVKLKQVHVLDRKFEQVYPSDHFGLEVEASL